MQKIIKNMWLYGLIVGVLIFIGAGLYWYYNAEARVVVKDFVETRDTQFILDIFKDDWYWLVSEGSVDFSPEHMLKYRTATTYSNEPEQLIIKVLYKGNEPVGFSAYYFETFYRAVIRFLAIRRKFRSQGYGSLLMNYIVNDLTARGATKIKLITRSINYPAQKVYEKAGFIKVFEEDGFVYYEKILND